MTVYCHINTVPNGSTGGIMLKEHRELLAAAHESHAFWGRGRKGADDTEFRFAADAEVRLDALLTRLDDRAGFHSKAATRRLLTKLDEIQPDVIHLHNLHGYYVNIEMLFGWLAKHEATRVEWTLHDCWAFTGHCTYFTMAKCEQWRSHCSYSKKCPQLREYPKTSGLGACSRNFTDKKRLFNLLPPERMKLITPSQWLADLVNDSFLSKYPVEVRHNVIDREVFKPTPSDFRDRYGIGDKFMVLGVASPWTDRKGIGDFYRLRDLLDGSVSIVLVGLSDKQLRELPEGIVGIKRTDSREELAAIYTAADVFFNPTKEDNYPTVNLEAEACGTPVVTYDVGGCAETIELPHSCVVDGLEELLVLIGNGKA